MPPQPCKGRKRMIVESPTGHYSSGLRPAPRPHRKSQWDGQENVAGCHFEPMEPQFNWLERRSPKFLGPPVTFSASSACLLPCFLLGLPQMLNPSSVGDQIASLMNNVEKSPKREPSLNTLYRRAISENRRVRCINNVALHGGERGPVVGPTVLNQAPLGSMDVGDKSYGYHLLYF